MLQTNHTVRDASANLNIANFKHESRSIYTNGGKRLLETCLILLALPFLLPLMVLIAIAVSVDGHSPFYTQDRLGKDWTRFRLFKFRTMHPDADRFLAEHLAANLEARLEWDRDQKLARDPRITPIGCILRKTSLDELPQLLNVLLGQMSLVGPRPMMPEQRLRYPGAYYATHRPGLTGLWQVSVRNGSTFAARADYDERYAREISLGLDVTTIIQTFRVVLRCTGC